VQAPILLPPKPKRTKPCPRCGQRYPAADPVCPHCDGLSDIAVARLRKQVEEEHLAHAALGRLFLLLAAVLAVVMLLVLL
jgi:hypothetical protein